MVVGMTKTSVCHSQARLSEGTWTCDLCGSESLDFELFEEAGEAEDCLARGVSDGVVPDPDDMVALAEVARARAWIEQANASLASMKPAVDKAAESFAKLSSAMREVGFPAEWEASPSEALLMKELEKYVSPRRTEVIE